MGKVRRRKHHLEGQRFGRLIVSSRASNRRRTSGKGTIPRWWCECDCGQRKLILGSSLVSGSTKSCGCLLREAGQSRAKWNCKTNRVWRIWRSMCCRAPVIEPRVLAIYQGVGTRDPTWSDFATFQTWALANGYADDLTLDRIDNDRGYWPDNCRWLSISAQQRNKTNHVTLRVGGETMILVEAAERFGLKSGTIRKRMQAGWPVELAVTKMPNARASELYARFAEPSSFV